MGHLLGWRPAWIKPKHVQFNALAKGVEGDFHPGCNLTPDFTFPADLTGTRHFTDQKMAVFVFQQGAPVSYLGISDEITVAPAKCISFLLEGNGREANYRRQQNLPLAWVISLWMATQNPDWTRRYLSSTRSTTWPVFLMHLEIDYPGAETELEKYLRLTPWWSRCMPNKVEAPKLKPKGYIQSTPRVIENSFRRRLRKNISGNLLLPP